MTSTDPDNQHNSPGEPGADGSPQGEQDEARRPWWKHLWVWLATVIGGVISAVLATLITGNGDTGENPSKPPATDEVFVRPFTDQGRLRPPFEATSELESGDCSGPSLYSTDPDAWRCGSEGNVMDPCWTKALMVACLRSPWDADVTVIKEATFPNSFDPWTKDANEPWALEIKEPDGGSALRCSWVDGATGVIHGERVNWRCSKGDTVVGDAAGEVSRSSSTLWSVLYSPDNSAKVQKAKILTVWY